MGVKLEPEEIMKAYNSAMECGQYTALSASFLKSLQAIALAAQKKLLQELEKQAQFNLSAMTRLDLFGSPMWAEIKKEVSDDTRTA